MDDVNTTSKNPVYNAHHHLDTNLVEVLVTIQWS